MKHVSRFFFGCLLNLLLLGLLMGQTASAQAPDWQRELHISTTGNSGISIQATTTDASNNVYITGYFTGTVAVGNSTLSSNGYDVFVAKWSNTSSSFVWAKAAGGMGDEKAAAIAVNGADVYIGGSFLSTAGFASMTFGSISLSGANGAGFVAKLTDTGASANFVWAYSVESAGSDGVNALAMNGNSLYVAGYFGGASVSFGSLTLGNGAGGYDVFVAKLTDTNSVPVFNWGQRAGSNSYDEATAIAVSGTNVYVTGIFSGAVTFGNTTLTNASSAQLTSDTFEVV